MWIVFPNPHRDLELLAKPERYEPVFEAGVKLLSQMRQNPNESFIFSQDPRVDAIKRAFEPVKFNAVNRWERNLNIHVGGGFGHYGYILELDDTGTYVLTLYLEDFPEKTKILKRTAASRLAPEQPSTGALPAAQAPSQP